MKENQVTQDGDATPKEKTARKRKPAKKAPRKKKEQTAEQPKAEIMIHTPEPPPAIIERPKTLSLGDPQQVMAFGQVLKSFITKNNLSTKIGAANYAHVDGWKFAGMNFGLTAIPQMPYAKHARGEYVHILYSVIDITTKGGKKFQKEVPVFVGYADHQEVIKEVAGRMKISREMVMPHFSYECQCDIVSLLDKSKVSFGVGLCSNLELTKSGFQEYAVNSMAQTRAIGKGFRNLLGFVMNAADHESTPAEEMDEINQQMRDASMEPPSARANPGKPLPNKEQFAKILSRVIAGTFDRKKAEEVFTFNDEQNKAIEIAEKARKQHQPG